MAKAPIPSNQVRQAYPELCRCPVCGWIDGTSRVIVGLDSDRKLDISYTERNPEFVLVTVWLHDGRCLEKWIREMDLNQLKFQWEGNVAQLSRAKR